MRINVFSTLICTRYLAKPMFLDSLLHVLYHKTTLYFVHMHLLAKIAWIHFGMFSHNHLHSYGVMEAQHSSIHSHNTKSHVGALWYWSRWCFRHAQRCSIGIIPWDCVGHLRTLDFFFIPTIGIHSLVYVRDRYHAEKSNKKDQYHNPLQCMINVFATILCNNVDPFFLQLYKQCHGLRMLCNPHHCQTTTKLYCLLKLFWIAILFITNSTPTATIRAKYVYLCIFKEDNTYATQVYKLQIVYKLAKLHTNDTCHK